MKIAVIGDGGWGTALAVNTARAGIRVSLWGPFPSYCARMRRLRENKKFLPGIKIPAAVDITADSTQALRRAELVILAVPSAYIRAVLKSIGPLPKGVRDVVSVIKGIEYKSGKRMSEVIHEEWGKELRLAVLSGPNIAGEVAQQIPSAAVCASGQARLARKVQDLLMRPGFRIYTLDDVIGVELGGALKNIIAIACGISDGLGFGANTKAALITRGLAEMIRLGCCLGASAETFYGLSGMGDVVTTCFSNRSRNRWLGEGLGRGKALQAILKSTEMSIEGVGTARAALRLSRRMRVDMPITTEVNRVLFHRKRPVSAVRSLMMRGKKREM